MHRKKTIFAYECTFVYKNRKLRKCEVYNSRGSDFRQGNSHLMQVKSLRATVSNEAQRK